MDKFFHHIREVENTISLHKKIINTALILCLGIVLGIFSKYLDTVPVNELPFILGVLDIGNFLGRFAIWVLMALCIAVYSNSSIRASINVFTFLIGMVTSYYGYSNYVAGFFPKSYAMIWYGFTIVSLFLAFICWYAKGKSKVSFILSTVILAILFQMTFVYGWGYFEARSILECIVFIIGCFVLRRNSLKTTMLMIGLGILLAIVLHFVMPFHFG